MSTGKNQHVPVMLDAVLEQWQVDPAGTYIDGTFGRGGHSRALLARLQPEGRLLVIDRDPAAAAAARALAADDARVTAVQGSFGEISDIAASHGVLGRVDGILVDLGVSSPQLDNPERGFSFLRDGPLDMRMNPVAGLSAAEWLNTAAEQDIRRVISRYGEERAAPRIARAIVAQREEREFSRTGELAALLDALLPRRGKGKHPATQTFQAIRIHINNELGELQSLLEHFRQVLRIGGQLCVISFHSLEDRLVKRCFRNLSRVDPALARLPVVPPDAEPVLRPVGKALRATPAEVAANPRARSAVLRTAVRVR